MNVVNIRKDKYQNYIGRGSPFGNPFVIGPHGSRKEVIEKFKVYFHERLENDPEFKQQVLMLKGRVLGCYCKPLACHGDVIIEYLERRDHESF